MEGNATETVLPDGGDETFVVGGEELTDEEFIENLFKKVKEYVEQNRTSTDTRLFSFLALLNAYVPESYLLMQECQRILGPPDPIHGGPPFEERMMPFIVLINTSSPSSGHIRMIRQEFAQKAVELLADLGLSRSAIMKNLIFSLCGNQTEPYILQFFKDLLTKRELRENGKEQFSRLIEEIQKHESIDNALRVLITASDSLREISIFPQTVARLYYIRKKQTKKNLPKKNYYETAEEWAKKAIKRAQNNSYVADTLGQIYKNRLMREAKQPEEILHRADMAFRAFEDVERKADKEVGTKMKDKSDIKHMSNSFNNRGLFGFIQVAKIAFEKLSNVKSKQDSLIQKYKTRVKAKFGFFEWYLTYSKPDMTSLEPDYFWEDVALCYERYTGQKAAKSTSFPGLLDCLNHGLFTSKGRRAGFEEAEKTVSDLEALREDLKSTYETNVDNVKAAERYILSNIILSNKMHSSSQLTPVKELQTIMHRFLGAEEGRSSEFYLLVLLLFWPEEEPRVVQEEDDEEVEQPSTEDDEPENQTWEDEVRDEEQETRGEPAQQSPDLTFDPDLQQHVTLMNKAFETANYAKYLRGRYLLPLFFLGKGSGLSKWIHKSRLDAIVAEKVDAELADKRVRGKKQNNKIRSINKMWTEGKVWHVPEIQDLLLPVQIENLYTYYYVKPQEHDIEEVFVCAGGKKITATTEVGPDASVLSPVLFYLGFTIQGPVVFKVGFNRLNT